MNKTIPLCNDPATSGSRSVSIYDLQLGLRLGITRFARHDQIGSFGRAIIQTRSNLHGEENIPIPLQFALNLLVGASTALVGGSAVAQERLVRSTAWWAMLSFETLISIPLSLYCLHSQTAWALMYLYPPPPLDGLSMGWLIGVLPAIGGLIAFVLSTRLLRSERSGRVFAVLSASLALIAGILWFGQRQLLHLDTFEAFQSHRAQRLIDHPHAYFHLASVAVFFAAWLLMVWKIGVYGRAAVVDPE